MSEWLYMFSFWILFNCSLPSTLSSKELRLQLPPLDSQLCRTMHTPRSVVVCTGGFEITSLESSALNLHLPSLPWLSMVLLHFHIWKWMQFSLFSWFWYQGNMGHKEWVGSFYSSFIFWVCDIWQKSPGWWCGMRLFAVGRCWIANGLFRVSICCWFWWCSPF
jgi:hypothetical protein